MRLTRLLLPLVLICGCAKTVAVEVAAHPAVALEAGRVAVVSDARECRAVADALVEELNATGRMQVDPRSDVRLHVAECGRSVQTAIDVLLEDGAERRRITLDGRAHALVAVEIGGGVASHLIGSGRHQDYGGWGDLDVLGRRRAMDRQLTESLALDLSVQVDPTPRIAERRVFPRAAEGSPRQLHSQAVAAEQTGDLREAVRLARLAHAERPTERTASYVEELERLLAQRGEMP